MNDEDGFSKLKQRAAPIDEELALLQQFSCEAAALFGADFAKIRSYTTARLQALPPDTRARIEDGWKLLLCSSDVLSH